ncbi:MAG: hypothetical protein EZS28_003649 [Streblomastix strix]|uniref:Uncharacterized protein n=1 Tax=Streblomastix strix TaxID=222440 RepID=A0A5J4X0C9_9EUKA|nr:MAG: hypothetical protein EZS28_003649 [Streblomastix strix]
MYLGDSDEAVERICQINGWIDELNDLWREGQRETYILSSPSQKKLLKGSDKTMTPKSQIEQNKKILSPLIKEQNPQECRSQPGFSSSYITKRHHHNHHHSLKMGSMKKGLKKRWQEWYQRKEKDEDEDKEEKKKKIELVKQKDKKKNSSGGSFRQRGDASGYNMKTNHFGRSDSPDSNPSSQSSPSLSSHSCPPLNDEFGFKNNQGTNHKLTHSSSIFAS